MEHYYPIIMRNCKVYLFDKFRIINGFIYFGCVNFKFACTQKTVSYTHLDVYKRQTLDNAVGVLVKRYLNAPKTHEADSAQSPVAEMSHHVLHVSPQSHLPVLVDLAAAPGRTVIFTRTKHLSLIHI